MKFHFPAILLFFFVGLLPLANAQEEPSFNIKFSPYPLKGENWSGLFYQNHTGKMVPVRIVNSRGLRSPEHTYTGESPLRFYRMKPNEEGVNVPVEVTSVPLDNSTGKYLFMFAQNPASGNNGREYEIFRMNDNQSSFPTGSASFFNACPETLYISFGKERFRIASGQFAGPFRLPKSGNGGIQVQMLKADEEGKPIPLLDSHWSFAQNNRELIIFAPSSTSALPQIFQLSGQ